MKILHVIYDDIKNPWCGGGGAVRAATMNEYIASKHDVTVISGNFPGALNETINGVKYVRIGLNKSYLLSRMSFSFILPFIFNKFSSDIVINDCSYFAPCFADIYTKRPCISIIHNLMGKHSFKIYSVIGVIPYLFEKILFYISKNIITPSNYTRKTLLKRYSLKNIVNIPNGISRKYFELLSDEKGYILFLGRVDIYMKGIDILIEAFNKVQDKHTKLVIVGDGKNSDVKTLRSMILKRNLQERIILVGRVHEEKKLELLRSCLFTVLPSRFEGWGIAAVEANASGKALLGSNIDGLKEAVINKKTAILVVPENAEALHEAMELLLHDVELRKSLGREGRLWAHDFAWDLLAEQQLVFYKSVALKCH